MANSYAEEDGKPQRVEPGGVSLGLAVDVERKDGTRSLVVPVIRSAPTSSTSPPSWPATTSWWRARATTSSRPTPTRAPTSPSPTPAGWAPWPRCRG